MQSSLKKSLYLGLAALSFVSVAAVSTNASAKSYAKAGAYTTLKAAATDRNVEATGTNALYTKPGTVKGAKVVASKKVMGELATSKKSANYFRAYGQKVTNRGSVYYRVVTMDGKYRGYVYGGKTEGTFAAGVKKAETTTTQTNPTKLTGYYLNDVSKNTIWTAPKYTQYKAKKVSLYGVSKDDTFTVDKAATKTREGSLYYHVTDDKNSAITGWIYAGKGYDVNGANSQVLGGLSTDKAKATATDSNSVKVIYRDANNAQVGSATWVTTTAGTKAGQLVSADVAGGTKGTGATDLTSLESFAKASAPTGYAPVSVDVTNATYGNNVYVQVAKSATSKAALTVAGTPDVSALTDGDVIASNDTVKTGSNVKAANVNSSVAEVSALTGVDGTNVTLADVDTALKGATFTGTTTYVSKNNVKYHYVYTYADDSAAASNAAAVPFGNTVNGTVSAKLTLGVAPAATTAATWLN